MGCHVASSEELAVLVLQDIVKHLFEDGQRALENNVAELLAAKDSLFHLFELHVLESEDALSVVVRNGCSLHLTDFHLHDVL